MGQSLRFRGILTNERIEFALETKYLFTNGPQRAILRPVWPGMARFTNMT